MKIPHQLQRNPVGLNMTPMIDVVFLLIIFFLVSSHLAHQENFLPLPLPTAVSGDEGLFEPRPRLTVNVLSDGRWRLGGETVQLDQLVERFQRLQSERGLGFAPEIRIRADRNVVYRRISPLLAAAAEAGIPEVSFAVLGGDQR